MFHEVASAATETHGSAETMLDTSKAVARDQAIYRCRRRLGAAAGCRDRRDFA